MRICFASETMGMENGKLQRIAVLPPQYALLVLVLMLVTGTAVGQRLASRF